MSIRWLVCGDFHGDTGHAFKMLELASRLGITRIIQLGDFGFFWPGHAGDKYMRKVMKKATELGVHVYVVDGNHENFDKLLEIPVNDQGVRIIGPSLTHLPRGFVWEVEDKKLLFVGGAHSIDFDSRVAYQRQHGIKVWWSQETLVDSEVENAISAGKVDVLFTHDCAPNYPMLKGYKDDFESSMHQQKVGYIAKKVQPELWFHGHMHEHVTYPFPEYGDWSTRVISLAMNGMSRSAMVLELKDGKFDTYFPAEEKPIYDRKVTL